MNVGPAACCCTAGGGAPPTLKIGGAIGGPLLDPKPGPPKFCLGGMELNWGGGRLLKFPMGPFCWCGGRKPPE